MNNHNAEAESNLKWFCKIASNRERLPAISNSTDSRTEKEEKISKLNSPSENRKRRVRVNSKDLTYEEKYQRVRIINNESSKRC